ncbi:hypothetical protein, variant [Saprolegnia diclina VS20]|uniref:Uncharacterized protein n=1 Tax=Saprolegnia diclina (strain VS20) TaxID=1156394 RepID=T0QR67_SAPDV|nr:hypothetical protein, variant [Saprolegnia diclina VS20]EQC40624.1 hypothetical protein, variant [Saprolegnia diclina VS20]|eukprot:XP_008605468.1 hypothetical protein, variant [Saprolegnia diclina VS20]
MGNTAEDDAPPIAWTSTPEERKERARIKKQDYNRERLRQKRCEHLTALTALTTEFKTLSATLARARATTSTSLLPWTAVAEALREERDLKEATNAALKQGVRRYRHLCRTMLHWLTSTESIRAYPTSERRAWSYSTLPLDSDARAIGLGWIAHRLYHNLDGYLERSELPTPTNGDRPYYRLDVRAHENSYFLTEFKQFVETTPLHVVAQCLYDHYFETYDGDYVDMRGSDFSYVRYACLYGLELQRSFPERMLTRVFREENRCIVFTHGVSEDAKYSDDPIKSQWTAWVVAERMDTNTTVIKHGFESFGLQTKAGFIDVADEAPFLRDVASDDAARFAQFQRYQRDYRGRRFVDEHDRFAKRLANCRGNA